MWKLLLLFFVAATTATAEKVKYENYKVFRVTPTTQKQVNTLQRLEEFSDAISFWSEPGPRNTSADIMVAPHRATDFEDAMEKFGLFYETYIDNVQSLIDSEQPAIESYGLDFLKTYHSLDEIYAYLDNLAQTYPDKVKTVIGGSTYEGRQIKGVHVSFKESNPGIFIEGGMHAREWISPATVLYITNELLTSSDPAVRALAESHDWYIFPSVNPDGYVYTHTKNRLWRKTRKPYGIFCHGSDPNRNWDYRWKTGGSSSIPCTETYAGSGPFSDVETKTLSRYLASIADKFYAYLSFHSYSQLLVFPYGHTKAHLDNYDDSLAIGKKSIAALARRYGTQYRTGNTAEVVYIATGGSVDWVRGTLKKPITFTYELRDKGRHGFLLPANQIEPTAQETLDSLVAMFQEAKTRGYPKTISTSVE